MQRRESVAAKQDKGRGVLFVISGPSGSGKTTLLTRLIKAKGLSGRLVKSVSLTTRPKRTGERHNRDYIYATRKRFLALRKAKKLLEWTRYLGYYYATPKRFVERNLKHGRHILLCLDVRGASSIRRLYPLDTVTVFVVPPSLKELKHRITKRCTKTDASELAERLRLAKKELSCRDQYDYYVMNNDLTEAIDRLAQIIRKELRSRDRQRTE